MKQQKRGRKRLGKMKRYHNIMLRFNDTEYDKLRRICESFNMDISQRGVISPLLRRLVLNGNVADKDRLPSASNLAYHINKIGNNINRLVKLANYKNLRSPNSNLESEIQKTNALLSALIKIIFEEQME